MKDDFAGQGGAYVMRDGKRVRVTEPTKDHPDGNRPRDVDGKPLDAAPSTLDTRPSEAPPPERPRGGPRKLTALDT